MILLMEEMEKMSFMEASEKIISMVGSIKINFMEAPAEIISILKKEQIG